MSKTLALVGKDAIYDVINEGDDIHVIYSEFDSSWTDKVKGKEAVRIHNNGNGVSIKFADKKKPIRLDYCQLCQLDILLQSYFDGHVNHSQITFARLADD